MRIALVNPPGPPGPRGPKAWVVDASGKIWWVLPKQPPNPLEGLTWPPDYSKIMSLLLESGWADLDVAD